MQGYGESGAKLILAGEHAVVYGIPAIAIPFNAFKTKVTINKINGQNTISSSFHEGLLKDGVGKIDGIIELISHVNKYLGKDNKNLHIKIESNILPQRGLGSSASVSIAVIRALFNYYDVSLEDSILVELATFAEEIHHSNPSGIDVNVLVYNKPVWFIRNKELVTLDINFKGSIIVTDSNIFSKTKEAVLHVAENLKNNEKFVRNEFDKINDISNKAKEALLTNDINLLGLLMNENQVSLKNIGVSSDTLDLIVTKLREFGALGAKLTGGGVGGCVISLARTEEDALNIVSKLKGFNSYIYNFGD